MVENKTNKHAHNTLDSSWPPSSWRSSPIEEGRRRQACAASRHRLEMVVRC
ncbi:Hypothetical protein FKW44_016840 [Caligus rogercresseyi]|uniref:Uncharacterized protein n=1 Tax=Caligus rogercresseyi TaxID=217165 RepID=A0A7T8H2C6_CALRO|nr:Hypothetical protein FKW44_016840 [Caligus rogercresseyi]